MFRGREMHRMEDGITILKEVIDEGDDEQKEQAENLLRSINAKGPEKE